MPRGQHETHHVWIATYKGTRGVTYRLRWVTEDGQTLSERAGSNRHVAERKRADKIRELEAGGSGRAPNRSITELVNILPMLMVGRTANTIHKTQLSLKGMIELTGATRIRQINRGSIMTYRAKRHAQGVTPATVNKDLRQIKSALSYAVDAEWIAVNPLLRWRGMDLEEADKVVRVIEPADVARIIDATPDHVLKALITVGYFSGMRRGELSNLRWEYVDLAGGVIHVVNRPDDGELTKSRRNRSLPMHPETLRVLVDLRASTPSVVIAGESAPKWPHVFVSAEGRRFLPDYITRAFSKAADAAGVACTPHDLRRSFSTMCQRAGVELSTVVRLGGWSCEEVVKRHYTGNVDAALQGAMSKMTVSLPKLRPNKVSKRVKHA